jgi:drug/metabolite transporter (DMT)-like permease
MRSTVGRERVHRGTLVGVAVGFCGLGLLLLPGSRPAEATAGGILLVLVAAGSWATGSFLSPRLSMPSDPLVSTGWQMVVGGGALLAGALATGEANDLHLAHASAKSLLAFAYLVLAGSLVAFTAYAWLLQNVPISKVATYAYVNPLVAVLLGWALLSEQLTVGTAAGAALIVVSVAAIVRRESAPSEGAEPELVAAPGQPEAMAGEDRCIKQPAVVDSVS